MYSVQFDQFQVGATVWGWDTFPTVDAGLCVVAPPTEPPPHAASRLAAHRAPPAAPARRRRARRVRAPRASCAFRSKGAGWESELILAPPVLHTHGRPLCGR